jgi:hypothetical protein
MEVKQQTISLILRKLGDKTTSIIYPPVWNSIKKVYTRREFLDLYLHAKPERPLHKKENELHQEIAGKIFS